MATTYQSPGVYVEEVDRGMKPIEGVGTAVAAFVGFTERAQEPPHRRDRYVRIASPRSLPSQINLAISMDLGYFRVYYQSAAALRRV